MSQNKLGETRRSGCIGNHGPGALADFREGHGAAISGVCGGLDDWPPGTQKIYERRLQSVLHREEFRLPPVDPDGKNLFLYAHRFPEWQHCPGCGRVRPASEWGNNGPGEPALICPDHLDSAGKPAYVAPVRFVVACDLGHLQDFPWREWVPHKAGCPGPVLKLRQTGIAGLAGLVLECAGCDSSRSFENAFQKSALPGITGCHGRMQWLGSKVPNCSRVPRVVQRGASNLYFPVTMSALAIPPFTEPLQTALNPYWTHFLKNEEAEWPTLIRLLHLEDELGAAAAEILAAVRRSRDALGATDTKALRHEEFLKFESGVSVPGDTEFEIRTEMVPPDAAPFFSAVVRAVRLREVRAQRGFTRLSPPDGEPGATTDNMAPLSINAKKWLPAVEMRGEGIFLRLNERAVKEWEERADVRARAGRIDSAYRANWHERFGADSPPPRAIEPRFILVHTLAHALMRQLTLACGYSSASLRERLYADATLGMAGLLIYTATTDSDGSLGGLERQGRTSRIGAIITDAVKEMVWCSNDPLCIDDTSAFSDPQNLAACHACLLASETSCEEFNLLLDRAMLVGRHGSPGTGYFEPMLGEHNDL